MSAHAFTESDLAAQDIEAAVARYHSEAGKEVALAFISELEAVYGLVIDYPHIGSPRFAHALNIPGLRHRKLRRYPWLVLYVVKENEIEVVRVLDARRDIPATLTDDAKD